MYFAGSLRWNESFQEYQRNWSIKYLLFNFILSSMKPHQSYGVPQNSYGPPKGPHFANTDTRCEGWRPIPGPSIGTANSNQLGQVDAIVPDNSYLPPVSNALSDSSSSSFASEGDLQLPISEAINFHTGQSNINVVQSESIEVSSIFFKK